MAYRGICPVCGWDASRDFTRAPSLCKLKREHGILDKRWMAGLQGGPEAVQKQLRECERLREEVLRLRAENRLLRQRLDRQQGPRTGRPWEDSAVWSFAEGGASLRPQKKAVLPQVLEVPGTWGERTVESLGSWAFQNRYELRELALPEGLTRIGPYCFVGCKNLVSISLPSTLTEIGSYAFYNCAHLEEIELPEGISMIESGTFSGCVQLTRVKLPASLKRIGVGAFAKCYALKELILPRGLAEIDRDAFLFCVHLRRVVLPESWRWRQSELYGAHLPGDCRLEFVKGSFYNG